MDKPHQSFAPSVGSRAGATAVDWRAEGISGAAGAQEAVSYG